VIAPGMCADGSAWIPAEGTDGRLVPICREHLVNERGWLRQDLAHALGLRTRGLGAEETSLVRETLPVWGTFAAMFLVVVPLAAWVLWKEAYGR
jgi:hypothetical protein